MRTCYIEAVNFSVYLDDESVRRLDAIGAKTRTSRNAVIRRAVRDLLAREQPGWPAAVATFEPDPAFPPFESRRRELIRPVDDPFSDARRAETSRRKGRRKPNRI
jgi:Arc/MetJ-type ribon-helix-helix transcriptional regulator